jgi:hypothetical protein
MAPLFAARADPFAVRFEDAMKALRLFLLLAGLMCLSGLAGVFLPMEAFAKLAARYGAGGDVARPFFEYLFRLLSATVASCGIFYLILAKNPERHGPLVAAGGGALVFVGAVVLGTGLSAGMPVIVTVLDFLGCAILGGLILAAWGAWGRKGAEGKSEPRA